MSGSTQSGTGKRLHVSEYHTAFPAEREEHANSSPEAVPSRDGARWRKGAGRQTGRSFCPSRGARVESSRMPRGSQMEAGEVALGRAACGKVPSLSLRSHRHQGQDMRAEEAGVSSRRTGENRIAKVLGSAHFLSSCPKTDRTFAYVRCTASCSED